MLIRRFLIAVLLSVVFATANAQTTIIGVVKDASSNETLPYVNIGIKHTNVGCITQKDGSFNIIVPKEFRNDSLTVSMVGYNDQALSIDKIASSVVIKLEPKMTQLS